MAFKNRIQKNLDMTKGDIYRLLITFALPLLLGDMFQQLYNMTDTWVIGNYASNDEYAAVGACFYITNLVIKSFIGLSSGAGIIISKYFGEGNRDKVARGSATAVCIALVCSVLFTVLGRIVSPAALRLSNVPDEVFAYAKSYLDIIFNLVAAQVIYNMGAGILRSVGDSRKPFLYLVAAAVINVVLDLYFVIVLGMGIKGVAWATAIAQCVAAALTVIELFRTKLWVRLTKETFVWEGKTAVNMIRLGIPTALQMAITSLSNVFIQSYINGLGVDFLSGFSTFAKCEQILFMASNSLGVACMTFVSQNIGAGNIERARDGHKASVRILSIYTGTICLFLFIFARPVSAFFNDAPEVVRYSCLALRVVTPFFLIQGRNSVMMGALRGCGDTKTPLFMQVAFNVLFRQIAMYTVTNFISYTPLAVLIVHPASWIVLFIAMSIVYSRSVLGKKEAKEEPPVEKT